MRRKGGAYTVDLEVEVTAPHGVGHEELHAAVLPHGTVILGGHGAHMLLLDLEHHGQTFVRMCHAERHLRCIGIFGPVDAGDGTADEPVAHDGHDLRIGQTFDIAHETRFDNRRSIHGRDGRSGYKLFHFLSVINQTFQI